MSALAPGNIAYSIDLALTSLIDEFDYLPFPVSLRLVHAIDSLSGVLFEPCRDVRPTLRSWLQIIVHRQVLTAHDPVAVPVAHVPVCGVRPRHGSDPVKENRKELRAELERRLTAAGYKLGDIFPELSSAASTSTRRKRPAK